MTICSLQLPVLDLILHSPALEGICRTLQRKHCLGKNKIQSIPKSDELGEPSYSAELRSFRRGCMALQSSKDKGSKQVSTTYFCFQALGMAVPCNSREVKLRAFRLRCFFILSFQLCCLAVLCLRRSYQTC